MRHCHCLQLLLAPCSTALAPYYASFLAPEAAQQQQSSAQRPLEGHGLPRHCMATRGWGGGKPGHSSEGSPRPSTWGSYLTAPSSSREPRVQLGLAGAAHPAPARETGPGSQTRSQTRSLLLRGHGHGTVGDRAAETPRHGGDVMSATAAQAAPRRLRPHPATTPRGGDAPAPPRHPPVAPRHAPAHATADAMRHRRRGPPGGRRAAVLTDGLEAGGSRGGCKASPVHPSCCMHLHAHAAPLSAHTAERAERAEWCVRRRRRTGPRARPYRPVSRCRARRWAARRPHAHKDIRNKTLVLRAAP